MAFPARSMFGKFVLEVGCGHGHDLARARFHSATVCIGIDIDAQQIAIGRRLYYQTRSNMILHEGNAEALPLAADCIDEYIARVSLPYSHIPVALKEARRVLRAGGYLFLTMHDLQMQAGWLATAIRAGAWRRVLDHGYIFAASSWFNLTGRCIARPGYLGWGYETFQTRSRMTKELLRAGFTNITHKRLDRHWVIEAQAKERTR